MRSPAAHIAAGALVALAIAAPSAQAVLVEQRPAIPGPGTIVGVVDPQGTADDLTAEGSQAAGIVVTTAGSRIAAGNGCTLTSSTVVTCQPGASEMFVQTGPGNDKFTDRTSVPSHINGGDGEDTVATAGNHTVDILGNPGNDTYLIGANVGRDLVAGGLGQDRVSYEGRVGQVFLTKDQQSNDGARGPNLLSEGDNINLDNDVERVIGGRGNDVITGGPLGDELEGGPGDDKLSGGDGGDGIQGGPGNDSEQGGPGSDVLGRTSSAAPNDFGQFDTGVDRFEGGDGVDFLVTADGQADALINCGLPNPVEFGGDFVNSDLVDPIPVACEQFGVAPKNQHPTVELRNGKTLRVRNGRIGLQLRCPQPAPGSNCVGTAEIWRSGKSFDTAPFRIAEGATETVSLEVGSARGEAEVRTTSKATDGRRKTTRARVRLR